ncbi:MAG TPA: MOSC N-terminal beta barrel domain-containing protein [Acetobacteraceae bacterium]|nr:MOSC N-terminal beta barrel domain-containing protein [Acetobacteraceae bacterium]
MRIEYLYRYPVKGLTAEALEEASLEPGGAIPWDRAFALAQGDARGDAGGTGGFDPAAPRWLPKTHFMCLMKNAAIARLRASFNPRTGELLLRAPDGKVCVADALSPAGRERIGAFLTGFLGAEARGTPRFHHVPGHVFGDQRRKVVSFINLASLADYERRAGAARERMRFRANVYFRGAPAWSELDWVGAELQAGSVRFSVLKRIARCPATEVNPASGERDADPVAELAALYGHRDLGIHAEVIEGGRMAIGDAIELLAG